MKYQFGGLLREVRERRKMTMKKVAEATGISESMVSQIERNKVSPAIDTLLSIAEFLGIDFEYLFHDYRRKQLVNMVRYDDRKKMEISGTRYEQLSKTLGNDLYGIEAYYMEIEAGGSSGNTEYGHQGKELGIITAGSGEFHVGDEVHQMGAGDSISFDASVPHRLVNTGRSLLTAYWVITPPKMFINK
jgi:transcriptional regulator with XRE-family HTH domain